MHFEKDEETIKRLNEASDKSRFKKVQPQKGHLGQKLQPSERSPSRNHFKKSTHNSHFYSYENQMKKFLSQLLKLLDTLISIIHCFKLFGLSL